MATWTTPKTWTATVVTVADLNTHIRDNETYLYDRRSSNGVDDFRLTLTTGVPVTSSDVLAAANLYATPYTGNRIALYDASGVETIYQSTEMSLDSTNLLLMVGTPNIPFDVFCYASSGVPTLSVGAWSNDTTRVTSVLYGSNGVLCKNGDLTRRYLGTVRVNATGNLEDSRAKRWVYNHYHQKLRPIKILEAASTWTYTTATLRQARANAANQADVVVGGASTYSTPIDLVVSVPVANSTGGVNVTIGIGEDSTTSIHADCVGGQGNSAAGMAMPLTARFSKSVAVGRHVYPWLEYSVATGTTTWYGTVTGAACAGISGQILM